MNVIQYIEVRNRLIKQLKFERKTSIALLVLTGLVWSYTYWFFEFYEVVKIPLLTVLSFAACSSAYVIWASTRIIRSLTNADKT